MALTGRSRWWLVAVVLVGVAVLLASGSGVGTGDYPQTADATRYQLSEDGRTLFVSWMGGPCSRELVGESTDLEETPEAVTVGIELTFRGPKPEWATRAFERVIRLERACTMEAIEGCSVFELGEPLGGRDVTDFRGAAVPEGRPENRYACDRFVAQRSASHRSAREVIPAG